MNQQHGFLLISVVVALFIISAVVLMVSEESVMEVRMLKDRTKDIQLRYLAEAGIQHAEWRLQQQGCGPYSDLVSQTFSSGTYSATIMPNNAGGVVTTYRVDVSDDAYIDKNNAATNFGNATQLDTYWTLFPSADKRALYRFDIANSGIPPGASIVSAVAKIFVIDPHNSATVRAYPVTADWSEQTVSWDNINTSYDSTSIASIAANTPAGQYVDLNITGLVQEWVNGSIANQGITLKLAFSLTTDLAQYSSKEYGNIDQRPYLEIKVSSDLSNRADISATAVLSNGASMQVKHHSIPLFQSSSSTLVLQPDSASGKDGWVTSDRPGDNYGTTTEMTISGSPAQKYFLGRFDVSSIPLNSHVVSARLEMYLGYTSGKDVTGAFTVHGMSQDWAEGSGDYWNPGDGVSWNTSDGTTAWSWNSNHSPEMVASDTINPAFVGWQSFEIAALVQQWVHETRANYGFVIKANERVTDAGFYSSDNTSAALRPKLTITYRCECGIVCQAPSGNGNVLMMVGNSATLAESDTFRKAMLESWGYGVNLLSDSATSTELNAAINNNDVVMVSSSVESGALGQDLASKNIGVVNEEGAYEPDFGFSTTTAYDVGQALEFTDTTHFITSLFATGVQPVYLQDMEMTQASGTLAGGGQTLATFSAAPGLMTLEAGSPLADGSSTAAGARVMLPFGRDNKMDWRQLNNNGRLLVQRSIQWAIDAVPAVPPAKKIYWTDDEAEVIQRSDEDGSHVETVVSNQYKVRGLDIDTVNGKMYWSSDALIKRADLDGSNMEIIYIAYTELNFDIKLDVAAGKMYWSYDNLDNQIMRANLDGSTVETLDSAMDQPMYFSLDLAARQLYASAYGNGDIMRLNFDGTGLTTVLDGADSGIMGSAIDTKNGKIYWSGGSGNDWIRRANLDGSNVETIITGLNAPQDIVVDEDNDRIYFTEALVTPSIKRANTDGSNVETIVSGLTRPRSIMIVNASEVPPNAPFVCNGVYLDEFNSISFGNSDGNLVWSTDWIEINESDGAGSGDERVRDDDGPYQLWVRDNDNGGEGVEREVDLTGANSATLRFNYRRSSLDNADDYVKLLISANGADGPWVELTRFSGPATDAGYLSFSQDISAYISANTRIRLLTSSSMGSFDTVMFDDVQIQCSP